MQPAFLNSSLPCCYDAIPNDDTVPPSPPHHHNHFPQQQQQPPKIGHVQEASADHRCEEWWIEQKTPTAAPAPAADQKSTQPRSLINSLRQPHGDSPVEGTYVQAIQILHERVRKT